MPEKLAPALFGEKYGDEVRVVSMGIKRPGKGLGGQTYFERGALMLKNGEIGAFAILSDSASSAGCASHRSSSGAITHLAKKSQQVMN